MKSSARIIEITLLVVIFAVFAGYNFMFAVAPANPPANNAPAPINVGTVNQVKNGGLSLNSLLVTGNTLITGNMEVTGGSATFTQVRTNAYCNASGSKCATIDQLLEKGPTCTVQYSTVSSDCDHTHINPAVSCPAGATKINDYTVTCGHGGGPNTNDWYKRTLMCAQNVCE